jgi:hypothetical protein
LKGFSPSPSWAIPSNTKQFTTRQAGILAGTLYFTFVANQDSQQLISLRPRCDLATNTVQVTQALSRFDDIFIVSLCLSAPE